MNKNGTSEYINSFKLNPKFQLYFLIALYKAIQKRIKNIPCIIPKIFTAIGSAKKYFSGIAKKLILNKKFLQ